MSNKIYKRKPLAKEYNRKIELANSIALKGKKLPERVKKKISERLRERKLTEEHKKHLSEALRSKPKLEEHKRKISETLKGKPQPWNAGGKCHFWRGGMMEKAPVKCLICGKINFIRKGQLEKLTHPYKCLPCSLEGRIVSLETRRKLSLAHRKYNLDETFFKKIDKEEKAYWLGFLAGDGAITDKNRLRLRLAIKDKKHLQRFKEIVKWNGRDYFPKHQNSLEVNFRSLKMVKDLANYFVTPQKTFRVRFPNIPKKLERHFIRGVFDADGCINKAIRISRGKSDQIYIFYGGEFNIEGNKEFILALQSRFIELGLSRNSINYSGKTINRIRYGGINQLKIIYQYLYESAIIFLERKKKLFEDVLRNYRCEIIKPEGKEFKIKQTELVKT